MTIRLNECVIPFYCWGDTHNSAQGLLLVLHSSHGGAQGTNLMWCMDQTQVSLMQSKHSTYYITTLAHCATFSLNRTLEL